MHESLVFVLYLSEHFWKVVNVGGAQRLRLEALWLQQVLGDIRGVDEHAVQRTLLVAICLEHNLYKAGQKESLYRCKDHFHNLSRISRVLRVMLMMGIRIMSLCQIMQHEPEHMMQGCLFCTLGSHSSTSQMLKNNVHKKRWQYREDIQAIVKPSDRQQHSLVTYYERRVVFYEAIPLWTKASTQKKLKKRHENTYPDNFSSHLHTYFNKAHSRYSTSITTMDGYDNDLMERWLDWITYLISWVERGYYWKNCPPGEDTILDLYSNSIHLKARFFFYATL